MSSIHRSIETMWWSDSAPPLSLRLFSRLYASINALNLELRSRRSQTPPLPLISVGNITAGGSGKTPFVIWLAGELAQRGFRPVVLCRGDGGRKKGVQLVGDHSDPAETGDEAVLLHRLCRCPVIAGRNRVRAARMATEYGDIIILDDGFQYRQLDRACDIVLVPTEGVGNGHLIPAGPMREPLAALSRADLIVRSGDTENIWENIRPLTSGREWRWRAVEGELMQVAGEPAEPPRRAVALTAIARPERFLNALKRAGIEVVDTRLFSDHHRFSKDEIDDAMRSEMPVICTGKDAVKLEPLWPKSGESGTGLWMLDQRIEAEPGLIEAIIEKIATPSGKSA